MRGIFLVFACLVALVLPAAAQELVSQEVSSAAWIDLRPAEEGAVPQSVPPWVTALEVVDVMAIDGSSSTLFDIHLSPAEVSASSGVCVELVFTDGAGLLPVITGVDAEGLPLEVSPALGEGLGTLTSAKVELPSTISGLHIEVPGDGMNVSMVYLSFLKTAQVDIAADALLPGESLDLFRRSAQPRPVADDQYLYGRVKALLLRDAVTLEGDAFMEVELEEQPLLAVLRLAVNGAEVTRPLWVSVNGGAAVPLSYRLPDIADPRYLGLIRGQEPGMLFRYAGWLVAEVAIPGHMLMAGQVNDLTIMLPEGHGPVAVRDVVLELKFNWDKLHYDLEP